MIKLNNLSRWNLLPKGQVLTLPGEDVRLIRLNVNSPDRCRLYYVDPDGVTSFLATVTGLDTVEFAVGGDVGITTGDDEVFFYTSETEPTYSVIENAEVFVSVMNRQARNPELEHMMFLQEVNLNRRLAAMADEINEKVSAAYDAGKATVSKSAAPGAAPEHVVSEGGEPDDDGGASGDGNGEDQPAGKASGGGGKSIGGNAGDDGSPVRAKPAV